MTNPTISVVCPAYNSVAYVSDTIKSVLHQTAPPLELIISDDGSTDDTMAVVEGITRRAPCAVQILHNVHKGPGAARNAGIRVAKGEWIAFLDSDDRWRPEKIERVQEAIRTYPDINFFCHDAYQRSQSGKEERMDLPRRFRSDVPLTKQLFCNCLFTTSAVVCRRDLLWKCGGFDETLPSAQDYELWLRLSPLLKVHFIEEVLGWHIDRPGNISSGKRWRQLKNEVIALTKNRRNAKMSWYVFGVARHAAYLLKINLPRLWQGFVK